MKKLIEVELIPQTSHFKNLRSELTSTKWDLLRKDSYKQANYCCEICSGKGRKWPVECHEIWLYENGIQTLTGLISLCPSCHETVHMGLAQIRGRDGIAKKHMMKINEWSEAQVDAHVDDAFRIWQERSRIPWVLDIEWAYTKLDELKKYNN